jgi:hypothetical protein
MQFSPFMLIFICLINVRGRAPVAPAAENLGEVLLLLGRQGDVRGVQVGGVLSLSEL